MLTPLLYCHPSSAYGTREDSVQLFSSSLQNEAYAHIKTCNHDKDTQLPRALCNSLVLFLALILAERRRANGLLLLQLQC